jgi:hypothetical protein
MVEEVASDSDSEISHNAIEEGPKRKKKKTSSKHVKKTAEEKAFLKEIHADDSDESDGTEASNN